MGDGRGQEYCCKGGEYGWEPPTEVPPPPSLPQVIWNSSASARFAGGAQKAVCFGSGGCELASVAFGCSSLHSKPTGLFYCRQQLLVELLIRLVRWNVDPIKAGTGQE